MKKNIAIIVMSCDNYSDIWNPFSEAWDKFWPDCPFEVYLVSEQKAFKHSKIRNIQTGKPMKWGEMLHFALNRINHSTIIYLQEDYLLRSKVDQKAIENLIEIFSKENAAYLRLLPWPGPDKPHPEHSNLGLLEPDSKYRTSLQAAIWHKEILLNISRPDDDGRFESWSIERAKLIDRPFLCLKRNGLNEDINHDGDYPLNYYATSVFQGKWLKEAIRLYRDLGIEIDTSHRGVMNRIDFMEYHERKNGTGSFKYKGLLFLKKVLTLFNL